MITLKASLHLHTKEDPEDGTIITYTAKDLIDQAHQLDFQVLAVTLHNRLYFPEELREYAQNKGIILLPGVELSLKKSSWQNTHILIIGVNELPKIKSLVELKLWRKQHPKALIIAPHPNFLIQSLGLKTLTKEADIFDAVEHSWFYTKLFNQNHKTAQVAKKISKPLVATSDMHDNQYLKNDYCLVTAETNSPQDIINAIKKGQIKNVTHPKTIFNIISFVYRFLRPRTGKKL